ncbi:hypothetical protein AGMMS50256_32450 [Betaproteobacteria bacterium]|nr:hypothetical protein AGMMS50256_32450 [Betaproteobacteria bacterium]
MMQSKNKDFVFSIALTVFGIYVLYEGFGIYQYAANPPFNIKIFVISPAFLPIILGTILILLSVLMFFESLRGEGNSLKKQRKDFAEWIKTIPGNPDIRKMTIGSAFMGIYVFFMMANLPFWIATLIFLFCMFIFLRVGKVWKIALIDLGTVGAIVLLFQVIFQTSLP